MVRAALGEGWTCVLANDTDPAKCNAYRANWGDAHLVPGDVAALDPRHLRQPVDLFWASSPCQDFSLAGKGLGLKRRRSSAFDGWVDTIAGPVRQGFAPRVIAFENVVGLLTSNGGRDFAHVCGRIAALGYRPGALILDAQDHLPQSRPRVFVVAVRGDVAVDPGLVGERHGDPRLARAWGALPEAVKAGWLWWRLPVPPPRCVGLADLVEADAAVDWHPASRVAHLMGIMSPVNLDKVAAVRGLPGRHVGTVYIRGRPDGDGTVRQQAEVRFDGIAGCLRTPAGGSSRQTLIVVEEGRVRARLLTAREAARLMGLPDSYRLPERYNDAYKLAADGVAVPVVRHLARTLLEPLVAGGTLCKVA